MSRSDEAERHGGGQFRVNLLVGIATLKLLIEKNIITAGETVQHVEDTKLHFPEIFDREDVAEGMKWPIELLHGRVPLHGSIIDRQILLQQREGTYAGIPLGQTRVNEAPRER